MKKQILILALFAVAVLATSTAYGQAIKGSDPRGIGCADDAMHPLAGKEYIYQAASNQTGSYTFWATQDADFISSTGTAPSQTTTTNMATKKLTVGATGDLLAATNYATTGATDNVKITWSDAILKATNKTTSPTFVVVNQDGTCANNLKVWSIDPIVAFTVDIKNMDHSSKAPLAYDNTTESQCFDAVRGAKFNAGTVQYDYGTQYLYWEVIAANFTVEYTPTFTISGLGNGQTATIEWDEASDFASPTAAVAIANGTSVTSATKVTTNLTNTSTGVSIYVRVTIKNNTFQGIASTPITLAVDGQNSVGDWDIVNNTVAAPTPLTCILAAAADKNDAATQTLNPRPDVTPAVTTPATTFVPGNETN